MYQQASIAWQVLFAYERTNNQKKKRCETGKRIKTYATYIRKLSAYIHGEKTRAGTCYS
jgi:hypothetical protein